MSYFESGKKLLSVLVYTKKGVQKKPNIRQQYLLVVLDSDLTA
jgi:hypothetical protein